jgi:hypothetical protein
MQAVAKVRLAVDELIRAWQAGLPRGDAIRLLDHAIDELEREDIRAIPNEEIGEQALALLEDVSILKGLARRLDARYATSRIGVDGGGPDSPEEPV